MHLHCELSISELTPAGGPIGLEKAAAGSNGGRRDASHRGGGESWVEEEKRGRRRRKGGGVGGVCKKSAKSKVQQIGKCSYVSSIKITKTGNQNVNYIVATWLFAVSRGWVRGTETRGRGAVHAAPSDWLFV